MEQQQTGWNEVHKLSLFLSEKSTYGSMPLEPAETRPRSNFPAFSVVQIFGIFKKIYKKPT